VNNRIQEPSGLILGVTQEVHSWPFDSFCYDVLIMQHSVMAQPPLPSSPVALLTSSTFSSVRQRRFATCNSLLCQAAALCVSQHEPEEEEEDEDPTTLTSTSTTKRSSSSFDHSPATTSTTSGCSSTTRLSLDNSSSCHHLGVAVLSPENYYYHSNKRLRRGASSDISSNSCSLLFSESRMQVADIYYQQGDASSATIGSSFGY
jgi:hypothetical protein